MGLSKREKEKLAKQKAKFIRAARETFEDAKREIFDSQLPMEIRRHSDNHYSIKHYDWTMQIYPGSMHVVPDNGNKCPRIDLPPSWTLVILVRILIETINRKN